MITIIVVGIPNNHLLVARRFSLSVLAAHSDFFYWYGGSSENGFGSDRSKGGERSVCPSALRFLHGAIFEARRHVRTCDVCALRVLSVEKARQTTDEEKRSATARAVADDDDGSGSR